MDKKLPDFKTMNDEEFRKVERVIHAEPSGALATKKIFHDLIGGMPFGTGKYNHNACKTTGLLR